MLTEVPPTQRRAVGASVDLGSNSVHLLVAAVAGHELEPLVDESVFLGLGTAVAKRGYLGASARAELADALCAYAQTAHGLDALEIVFIGTEPIRRAADAAAIVAEVWRRTGAPLHVVSHEEEALLTLIGVTEGRPVRGLLVVDIGGGSSEFSMVDGDGQVRATGLRVGSLRLTDALVKNDPPTEPEIEALRAAASGAVGEAPDASPGEIVAVGGTASNLIKVLHLAPGDRLLTHERIDEAIRVVAVEPSEAAAARHLINPRRARLLPAGGAILDAILACYGLDSITVSESGVREGAVRVAKHAGREWRDRLPELARGWRT